MYVSGRTPPRTLTIPNAQVREIVKRVLEDPRIQRAAAKLAKAPAPAPFRKVATVPSEIPGMAKLVRQRAAVAETLSDIRKHVDDERAVQKSITATLDRVGRKLDAVNEVAERIGKVGERFETFATQLRGGPR